MVPSSSLPPLPPREPSSFSLSPLDRVPPLFPILPSSADLEMLAGLLPARDARLTGDAAGDQSGRRRAMRVGGFPLRDCSALLKTASTGTSPVSSGPQLGPGFNPGWELRSHAQDSTAKKDEAERKLPGRDGPTK